MARGIASIRSPAISPSSPISPAARSPARPWRKTPASSESFGSNPRAKKLPTIPAIRCADHAATPLQDQEYVVTFANALHDSDPVVFHICHRGAEQPGHLAGVRREAAREARLSKDLEMTDQRVKAVRIHHPRAPNFTHPPSHPELGFRVQRAARAKRNGIATDRELDDPLF